MPISDDEMYGVLEDFIIRLFSLAESEGMDTLVELDVSFSQARMVFMLAHCGQPLPINEIAAGVNLSTAAAGRNVDRLVKLGLVERRERADDRRVKLVTLTPNGQQVASLHLEAKRAGVRAFVSRLPAAERERLHAALFPILAGEHLRSSHQENNS